MMPQHPVPQQQLQPGQQQQRMVQPNQQQMMQMQPQGAQMAMMRVRVEFYYENVTQGWLLFICFID